MALEKTKPHSTDKTSERTVAILGATGSVGQSTLDLVRQENRKATGTSHDGPLSVEVLTAEKRVTELIEVAKEFRPKRVAIGREDLFEPLKDGLAGLGIQVDAGRKALVEAASGSADWVMAAIVGAAGLEPTLAAVDRGATVAFANKECLVCAGDLFMDRVRQSGGVLLPVDSEHNAVFQVFDFDHSETIEKITLTASGGPFRTWSREQMSKARPDEAVAHPNWSMGQKISVDSATLMNKGLELIEAFHLFPVAPHQLDILVHPESIIHSLVTYRDGSVLSQMGSPDMRTPIAYTLAWPSRMETPVAPLDLAGLGRLTFESPDAERFPALGLTLDCLQTGGSAPTILNAANEVAVARFLRGDIGFLEITEVVKATLDALEGTSNGGQGGNRLTSLEGVFDVDRQARDWAERWTDKVTAA